MTPKEKAIEIYERYYYSISDIPEYNLNERAIDCSLICVDEIIKSEPVYPMGWYSVINYWKEVRKELINLK
jgi:hypothetical protein